MELTRNEALRQCRLLVESDMRALFIWGRAGMGKTVLARQFLDRVDHPFAWIACTDRDTDSVHFFNKLLQAQAVVVPGLPVDRIAQSMQGQPAPAVAADVGLGLLLSELAARPRHSLICVDDAHLLEASPSQEMLSRLLRQAPNGQKFVVVSRRKPDPEFFEPSRSLNVDESLLLFSKTETAALYTEILGIPCSAREIAAIHEQAEGWITGLLLAAPNHAARVPGPGSHDSRELRDYFLKLVTMPEDERAQGDFLCLALLEEIPEEFLETRNPECALAIRENASRNLFIAAVQDRGVYRLHHLLRDALRNECADRVSWEGQSGFLRQAADWHLNNGDAQTGLELYTQAEDWSRVLELLRSLGLPLLMANAHTLVLSVLDRLDAGTDQSAGWRKLLRGAALMGSDPPAALDCLDKARNISNEQGDAEAELLAIVQVLFFHVFVDGRSNRKRSLMTRAEELYEAIDDELDPMVRTQAAQTLALGCFNFKCDYDSANRYFAAAAAGYMAGGLPEPPVEFRLMQSVDMLGHKLDVLEDNLDSIVHFLGINGRVR